MNGETQNKKLPLWLKGAHGFGSAGFGVKDNGFNYFLLIFYGQVVGMDTRLVGLAVLIALIVDAISDPIVGYWSDNLRSKWGRRHPFMYGAIIPVTLSYFLLWTPPAGWSDQALFWWVLILAIIIRTALTFYETPSTALNAELTQDYDERSSLVSYRLYFAWTIGNLMTVSAFFFIFPTFSAPDIPDGMFNRESYFVYGLVASVLIFLAIVVSSVGTHARIPTLKAPPPKRSISLWTVFREIFESLSNRSFIALFGGSLFAAIGTGIAAGLAFYFLTYMWEFDSIQRGWFTFGTFFAAAIGFWLAPVATRRFGKKKAAMLTGIVAFVGSPLPIFLRVIGVMPENGTPELFWIVFIINVIDVGLIICFQALTYSMLADLVEQSELRTGRRSEGTFAAANTFIRKMVQGFGVTAATIILTIANFPVGAAPSAVPQETVVRLGILYIPTVLTIWGLMMLCISAYRIDRKEHEENLRKLNEA